MGGGLFLKAGRGEDDCSWRQGGEGMLVLGYVGKRVPSHGATLTHLLKIQLNPNEMMGLRKSIPQSGVSVAFTSVVVDFFLNK